MTGFGSDHLVDRALRAVIDGGCGDRAQGVLLGLRAAVDRARALTLGTRTRGRKVIFVRRRIWQFTQRHEVQLRIIFCERYLASALATSVVLAKTPFDQLAQSFDRLGG